MITTTSPSISDIVEKNIELFDRFIDEEKKAEDAKKILKQFNATRDEVALLVGDGGHFASEEGIVFKFEQPKGRWVEFDKFGYVRTRREDEKKGSLAMSEAKELGYDVK